MIVSKSYSINKKLHNKTHKSRKDKSKKSKSRKQKNRLFKKTKTTKKNRKSSINKSNKVNNKGSKGSKGSKGGKGSTGTNLLVEHIINSNSKKRNHSSIIHSKSTHSRIVQFNQRNQYGGTNCDLATVSEPGFNLPDSGGITGLNIGEARGILYRPNCKTDTYQAMVPP